MAKIKHLSHNNMLEKSMEKAKKYLADENYVDAKDEIERVLDVNPMDDRALNLLAIIMLKLEQYSKAVKIYEDLIARYPTTMPLKVNLGVAYLKNNQMDDAVQEFSAVLQKEPENKTVLKLSGKALLKLNRTEEALEAFTKAGLHDYVKKIKKHGASEAVVSELSTEDVLQEPIGKDKAVEQKVKEPEPEQKESSEQSDIPGKAMLDPEENIEEPPESPESPESVGEPHAEDTHDEQAQAGEEIIETERGPSAIDDQELYGEEETSAEEHVEEDLRGDERPESGEHQEPEEQLKPEGKTEPEPPVDSEVSVPAGEPVQEKASPAEEQPLQEENIEESKHLPVEGLASISEKISLSKFTAPVNFINDSMLLFNLDGNLVYVRDRQVVSISESLTIEQAYKRYRGKDTKSIFADKKDDPVVLVYGKGGLLIKCDFKILKLFRLKNEFMFLNDERLIAFQGDLEWENGRVELTADKSINVTQMKGTADLFLGISNQLLGVKVTIADIASIRLNSLVGWHGKLIPRPSAKKHYTDDTFISFHGEGVVFIDA